MRTLSSLISTAVVAVTLLCLAGNTTAEEKQEPVPLSLETLLRDQALPLRLDGTRASGPGFERLLANAAESQFFILAEEHNLLELNRLAVALFDRLHAEAGYEHLVLEQGSVIAGWLDRAAAEGGFDAVANLVRRYPHAPTFATDEEFELVAHVRRTSDSPGPAVWGVDQELAALHILERLAELAPDETARGAVLRLAEEARPHEETRTGDVHYLYSVADPAAYDALPPLFRAEAGGETEELLAALLRTVRIYQGNKTAESSYLSGREREFSMRARFMERYRQAQSASESTPRALVKMGHWHTLRGFYRSDVPTFGNFLSEFATAQGLGSVVVSTYVVGSPEAWRNTRGVLARVADPDAILVVDLRPLRPLVHAGRVEEMSDSIRRLIFRADMLLLVGGGQTGSYGIAHGVEADRH
jgi:hypothetical protein